jgi:hypothetical protein
MKTYENFIKDFFKKKPEIQETKDQINNQLIDSIDSNDYVSFMDAIKKGADVNFSYYESQRTFSPLISLVYGWRYKTDDRLKYFKVLLDHGINLFDNFVEGPEGPYEIDVYDAIESLISPEYRKEYIDLILQKYPDYMEEREMRKNANKYNL